MEPPDCDTHSYPNSKLSLLSYLSGTPYGSPRTQSLPQSQSQYPVLHPLPPSLVPYPDRVLWPRPLYPSASRRPRTRPRSESQTLEVREGTPVSQTHLPPDVGRAFPTDPSTTPLPPARPRRPPSPRHSSGPGRESGGTSPKRRATTDTPREGSTGQREGRGGRSLGAQRNRGGTPRGPEEGWAEGTERGPPASTTRTTATPCTGRTTCTSSTRRRTHSRGRTSTHGRGGGERGGRTQYDDATRSHPLGPRPSRAPDTGSGTRGTDVGVERRHENTTTPSQ